MTVSDVRLQNQVPESNLRNASFFLFSEALKSEIMRKTSNGYKEFSESRSELLQSGKGFHKQRRVFSNKNSNSPDLLMFIHYYKNICFISHSH